MTFTANGSQDFDARADSFMFGAVGTFDGATIKVQHKVAGTYVDVPNSSLTDNGAIIVQTGFDTRATVSNAGSSTSITVEVVGLDQ